MLLRVTNHECRVVPMSQAKINQLQTKLREYESHSQELSTKNDEMSWGTAVRHMFQKQMSGGHISVRKIFTVWFKHAMMMKSERQLSHVADTVAKRRLLARMLAAWDRVARGFSRNKLERAAERRLESVTKEIISRYESEVQKLRGQLGVLQQEVLDGHRRRQILEDELRRTLLKGMAAMSMDALHIFSSAAASDASAAQLAQQPT